MVTDERRVRCGGFRGDRFWCQRIVFRFHRTVFCELGVNRNRGKKGKKKKKAEKGNLATSRT